MRHFLLVSSSSPVWEVFQCCGLMTPVRYDRLDPRSLFIVPLRFTRQLDSFFFPACFPFLQHVSPVFSYLAGADWSSLTDHPFSLSGFSPTRNRLTNFSGPPPSDSPQTLPAHFFVGHLCERGFLPSLGPGPENR